VDELIINVLMESASPFDRERLRRWRDAAPENEEYYQETARVWGLTAPEPVVPASGPSPVEEILAAAPLLFPDAAKSEAPESSRRRFPWVAAGLLAASVTAIGLGLQWIGSSGRHPLNEYRAALDETRTVTLEDGSFVRLAQGSHLQEWEGEERREVSLEGRAFFAVARNESRPFVVRTELGEVRVLGTRFQVDTEGDEVEILVVEGLVSASNDEGSVEVPAGSLAGMADGALPWAREVDDPLALMDWPGGVLVFHATALAQVVEEVSRQYGRPIRIDAPELSQRRVTAWFQGEPFEAVAESLCIVTEAVCRTDADGVHMGTREEGAGG